MKFTKYSGINNVLASERLDGKALTAARNIDFDLTGAAWRRQGYTLSSPSCHRNLWQGRGFLLATTDGDGLVAVQGVTRTVVHPTLGPERVWYTNLPTGATVFSNGLVAGMTSGGPAEDLGVKPPQGSGAFMSIPGALFPGKYQWHLTHTRTSDGLESGTTFGGSADVSEGGLLLTGLPAREGHTTNVYLTGADGDMPLFAGVAAGPAFSFVGQNSAPTLPCRTAQLVPLPVGTLSGFWRGRVLMAAGRFLAASRPNQYGLHDPRRDVKQFSAPITMIQPVAGGIFVGTEAELAFLRGPDFDSLTYTLITEGRVALGSGVRVPGQKLRKGDGVADGDAMLCIAAGSIVAGFEDGSTDFITDGRYHTDVQEVHATYREVRGVPQYVAVPA